MKCDLNTNPIENCIPTYLILVLWTLPTAREIMNLCVICRYVVPLCVFAKATLKELGILVHSYDNTGNPFFSKHYLSSGFCISKAAVKQMLPLLDLHFFELAAFVCALFLPRKKKKK